MNYHHFKTTEDININLRNFKVDSYKVDHLFVVEISLDFQYGDISVFCGHGITNSEAENMAKMQYLKGNKFNQNTQYSDYKDYLLACII